MSRGAMKVKGPYRTLPYLFLMVTLLASLLFLASGFYTFRTVEKTLEASLKLQALSLETTFRGLVKSFDLKFLSQQRDFFSELLLGKDWEAVAYIAIYDREGKILLHSNPELAGKGIEKIPQGIVFPRGFYQPSPMGETIYLYENLLKLRNSELVLRIALHVGPIEQALAYARGHAYLDFFLSLLFLSLGVFGFLIYQKAEGLRKKVEDLERWRFISQILAHELKNPLASIKGFAQVTLKRVKEERDQKALSLILKEALRLERLLKNLNLYTQSSVFKLFTFDLKELLQEVLETFKVLYPETELLLNLENGACLVQSDADKLKEILINLLENSLQASQEKGDHRVDLALIPEENYYTIKIKDFGPGVPKELLSKIWDPFFTTKAKGMGLGLTIVKKLCEELNCKLEFKSKEFHGTEVWLKIPK